MSQVSKGEWGSNGRHLAYVTYIESVGIRGRGVFRLGFPHRPIGCVPEAATMVRMMMRMMNFAFWLPNSGGFCWTTNFVVVLILRLSISPGSMWTRGWLAGGRSPVVLYLNPLYGPEFETNSLHCLHHSHYSTSPICMRF